MNTNTSYSLLGKIGTHTVLAALAFAPIYASAQVVNAAWPPTVNNVLDMFTEGSFSGDVRTFYYGAHNAFYNKGLNQNTVTYGGGLEYKTASLYGISMGVSGYIARGAARPDDPSRIDGSLGPNITTLGEAYLQWEHAGFKATAGNQVFDAPFTSPYDYRIAPQLFQGISATYGTPTNNITAFRMTRWKSWISDSFTQRTAYNVDFDSASNIGLKETPGFGGIGGTGTLALSPISLAGQAYYIDYIDYARMGYLQGTVSKSDGEIRPFVSAQLVFEQGDNNDLLGHVSSQVYGFQLGVKRNTVTVSLGYDYTKPHSNSYLNGALVTPYAHNMASGPLFAQPFITSTQDLGAGSAYALDITGSPTPQLTLGARYSFMDLIAQAGQPSLDQSEYLIYATYNFSGKLRGFSITDFFAYQLSPAKSSKFFQNRLQLQYAWGPSNGL